MNIKKACLVHGEKWSSKDDKLLRKLTRAGVKMPDIVTELRRTLISIRTRRTKLGIKVPRKKKIPKVQKYCKAKDCDNPCRMSFCGRACERFTNKSYVSESREEYLKRLNKNK